MPSPQTALEYARGVHAEAHDFNKEIYRRAQIVLTLDGIAIAAAGAGLATQPEDLERAVGLFEPTTWAALTLAGAALIAAVLASTMALFSRHLQGTRRGDARYVPANMWFYRSVAELDPDRFVEVAEQADAAFEARARLAQVTTMAPIMVRRANWLNGAFACTSLAFVAFALAAADYVIRLGS